MVSTIGVVSLSSGIIGEDFSQTRSGLGCPTSQEPGTQSHLLPLFAKWIRLYQEPSWKLVEDLIHAFFLIM